MNLVIEIEGGALRGVYAAEQPPTDLRIIVVDKDTDGDDGDLARLPDGDDANVWEAAIEIDPTVADMVKLWDAYGGCDADDPAADALANHEAMAGH